MSAQSVLAAPRVKTRSGLSRTKVLHILEATSAGAARFVADVLLHHDTDQFDVSFAYSLIRSDQRFLSDLEKICASNKKRVDCLVSLLSPHCAHREYGIDALLRSSH